MNGGRSVAGIYGRRWGMGDGVFWKLGKDFKSPGVCLKLTR